MRLLRCARNDEAPLGSGDAFFWPEYDIQTEHSPRIPHSLITDSLSIALHRNPSNLIS